MATANIAPDRAHDKPTIIYALIDPRTNEARYVGKTRIGLARRLIKHVEWWKYRPLKKQTHVSRWVGSLISDNIAPEIVEIDVVEPFGDWIEAEQFWIAYFRFLGARLTNLTDGGEGIEGYRHTPERVERHREMMILKWQDPDYRARTTASHVGKSPSPESIAKRAEKSRGRKRPAHAVEASLAGVQAAWDDPAKKGPWVEKLRAAAEKRRGVNLTPEHCAKLSAAHKGKPKSEERNRKVGDALRGRPKSEAHKAALKAAQLRRRERERAERASS